VKTSPDNGIPPDEDISDTVSSSDRILNISLNNDDDDSDNGFQVLRLINLVVNSMIFILIF
jgi:hypothetical protein